MRLADVARRLARSVLGTGRSQDGRGRGRGTAEAPAPPRGRRPGAPKAPARGRVVLGYAPSADGDADPGEVVWAWVPFEEDPRRGKDRPALVIGRSGRQLVVIPLTSKDRAGRLPVGRGRWDSSGRASYADVERLLTVDPATVRREGAALDRPVFDAVVSAARRHHDLA
jgi:hypothetical protein